MNYKKVEKFLSTLIYSWGGDPPAESVWAANDFLDVLEGTYNYKFTNRFVECHDESIPNCNFDAVLKEIKALLNKNKK